MQRSDNQVRFRYPIYNPAISVIDVADDWGRGIFEGVNDLDLVMSQPYRIAALPIYYNKSDAWSYQPRLADLDLSKFDLVLFSDPEYHDLESVRRWMPVQHSLLATGGISGSSPIDTDREVYRPYYIRDFIDQNRFQDTGADYKPFQFEALLGARRPHRDFVWKAFHRSGLLANSIVTYRSEFPGDIQDYLSDLVSERLGNFMQWPYVSPNLDPRWEVSKYVTNLDSRKSPLQIYQRTWYSIVCETLFTGNNFFLSEKTIKAMFNKRIFVMFANAKYLARLHEHGFQTFNSVIDENYDEEKRDIMRYEKALHQVWRLAWLENSAKNYRLLADILDQNHRRLFELEEKRCSNMLHLLIKYIPTQHWHWAPIQTP